MKWEHLVRNWTLVGPERDDWPGRALYVDGMEQQSSAADRSGFAAVPDLSASDVLRGDEGAALRRAYAQWCVETEQDHLNEYGDAGFELVSVDRQVHWPKGHHFPVVRTQVYLKREATPGAPEPPKGQIPPAIDWDTLPSN
jgi:hypothetical protein